MVDATGAAKDARYVGVADSGARAERPGAAARPRRHGHLGAAGFCRGFCLQRLVDQRERYWRGQVSWLDGWRRASKRRSQSCGGGPARPGHAVVALACLRNQATPDKPCAFYGFLPVTAAAAGGT